MLKLVLLVLCWSGVWCNSHKHLYRLDIIHFNDFHDRFEETTAKYPVCSSDDNSCIGGFARLYYEVELMKRKRPDALVLDAGDNFQGTYWYTLLKWHITQEFINLLPIDVHTLGNHEFDDGVEGLRPYLKVLKGPVVVANMDTSNEPLLHGLVLPSTILKKRGRQIGVIGLLTPATAVTSDAGGVRFSDPVAAARAEARRLTDLGVDIIVVLSHCGLNIDMRIASEAGEHVDLIVGGHSHSLLLNGTGPAPDGEARAGPYPMTVPYSPNHNVLIVTAAAFSKYLGNLTVFIDPQGEITSYDGEPIFLDRQIPEDRMVKARLAPYTRRLHALVDEVQGSTTAALGSGDCGGAECAFGDLLADSFVAYTKQKISSPLPHIAIVFKSNLRGDIPKGDITMGAIINVLPFTNKITTFVLKGRYVVDILERGLQNPWRRDPFAGPHFPQVSGMFATLNVTSGEVTRAQTVAARLGSAPLEPWADYQLTMFDFYVKNKMFEGILSSAINKTILGIDRNIFRDFVRKNSPLHPKIRKRLTVVT